MGWKAHNTDYDKDKKACDREETLAYGNWKKSEDGT